ncbi:hypothetical protein Y1Q_0012530 [Alligator mississippiensis]|uniref:Uncharacterized protein n=1 Tax=Alligator mississippiensis TaxID=8496 RepID=A0A151M804_ALLMI|nr:hypothetical protein Y1Q_0012530 [Alligator mississippiensis]
MPPERPALVLSARVLPHPDAQRECNYHRYSNSRQVSPSKARSPRFFTVPIQNRGFRENRAFTISIPS